MRKDSKHLHPLFLYMTSSCKRRSNPLQLTDEVVHYTLCFVFAALTISSCHLVHTYGQVLFDDVTVGSQSVSRWNMRTMTATGRKLEAKKRRLNITLGSPAPSLPRWMDGSSLNWAKVEIRDLVRRKPGTIKQSEVQEESYCSRSNIYLPTHDLGRWFSEKGVKPNGAQEIFIVLLESSKSCCL